MNQMMGGNPMMMLINVMLETMRSGQNPMAILQQMAMNNNPQAVQAMRFIQGKNSAQLKQTAENMARQRGMSLEDVARQLGITLPSDR